MFGHVLPAIFFIEENDNSEIFLASSLFITFLGIRQH